MATDHVPGSDAGLLAYTNNFSAVAVASGAECGWSAQQISVLGESNTRWSNAYAAAVNPATRGPASILAKNIARAEIVGLIRQYTAIAQAYPLMTDVLRQALGINIRKTPPTPIPVPTARPTLDIVSVRGRTIKVRLHGEDSTRRGKPAGVAGANLYSFVGEIPPESIGDWTFQGGVTRTTAQVNFSAAIAPGTTVWITACWTNPREQAGPTATPASVTFGAANVSAGGTLRIAA